MCLLKVDHLETKVLFKTSECTFVLIRAGEVYVLCPIQISASCTTNPFSRESDPDALSLLV